MLDLPSQLIGVGILGLLLGTGLLLFALWSKFTIGGTIQRLNSGNGRLSAEAAGKLGTWRTERAVPDLLQVLRGEFGDERVAYPAVARALGQIGDSRAVLHLESHLQDYSVADSTVDSLVLLYGDRGTAPWIPRLQSEHVAVRASAAMALRCLGDKRAIEPLSLFLAERIGNQSWDRHQLRCPHDVKEAVVALRSLGGDGQPLLSALGLDGLTQLPLHERALLGDQIAIGELVLLLNDPFKRLNAARTLAVIGDRRAFDVLVAIYGEPYHPWFMGKFARIIASPIQITERCLAASALGALGDRRAITVLEARMSDYDFPSVRDAAARALARLENL